MPTDAPLFFESRAMFRVWLEANHDRVDELWVGFYKKGSGLRSVTYVEAVEEALCFGWIDGVRNAIDKISYTNRFTPRRQGSNWSDINLKRVEALITDGLMHEAGLRAFNERDSGTAPYSYENRPTELPEAYLNRLRANEAAWQFFSTQAPWYQRSASFWVMDAKREETRERRLETLIADSEAGWRIKALTRPGDREGTTGN